MDYLINNLLVSRSPSITSEDSQGDSTSCDDFLHLMHASDIAYRLQSTTTGMIAPSLHWMSIGDGYALQRTIKYWIGNIGGSGLYEMG